ncbi:MAG TPA: DUF2156 domain-containing protein [Polyangiaceae bacterium]|nr:DUF2156 domain-containing protein [Polyangiaceae bacterium]
MSRSPAIRSALEQRHLALEAVLRHGWNATAFQTLNNEFKYFFSQDACVAYVDTGSAWVVAGAPIAATERLREVTQMFLAEARSLGRRCCFFGTEPRFLKAAAGFTRSLSIGEQPVWNPQLWPETLARHASLREQIRRARAKGVMTRALDPGESIHEVIRATRELAESWSATHAMPPMGFLVRVNPFSFPEQRRCIVAERAGRVLAVAHLVPVPKRAGWFIEHLLRAPDAPNGTTELLVHAAMTSTRSEGCRWLTLGLAPLSGEVSPVLRLARQHMRFLYDFEGLRRFKAKLRPSSWQPIYLTHPVQQSAWLTLRDVLAAFADDSFLRFGARTLWRGLR